MTKAEKIILFFSLALLLFTLGWFFRSDTPAAFSVSALPAAPEEEAVKLNINSATAEELELLPGIGPVLAERILEYIDTFGPMEGPEDLTAVSGIGEKIAAGLANYICYGEDNT